MYAVGELSTVSWLVDAILMSADVSSFISVSMLSSAIDDVVLNGEARSVSAHFSQALSTSSLCCEPWLAVLGNSASFVEGVCSSARANLSRLEECFDSCVGVGYDSC